MIRTKIELSDGALDCHYFDATPWFSNASKADIVAYRKAVRTNDPDFGCFIATYCSEWDSRIKALVDETLNKAHGGKK